MSLFIGPIHHIMFGKIHNQNEINLELIEDFIVEDTKDIDFAQYWYLSHFPNYPNTPLSEEEQEWVLKLNRIGINYFRPIVAIALSLGDSVSSSQRVDLLKEIERFIFINFRMARINSSYQSSNYYRVGRDFLLGNIDIEELTEETRENTNRDE